MKKINLLLIIQVQIIFVLVIYLLVEKEGPGDIENKAKIEKIQDKLRNGELELLQPLENEISLGEHDSTLRVVFYSRPDCKYCDQFLKEVYPNIKTDYLDKGYVTLAIRYLTHPSKPKSLYATKCAHLAHEYGLTDAYLDFSGSIFPDLDTLKYHEFMINAGVPQSSFESFMRDQEIEEQIVRNASIARGLGISQTPTIYFGERKVVGNKDYSRIKTLIEEQLQ